MGLRLIEVVTKGTKAAKVYRDSEWQEFRVKFFDKCVHITDADYHTDDKADAVSTAKWQIGLV